MVMISVIVPVYNAEKYIKRCVESIIQQTYTDFEIILIDNNSTDLSYKISMDFSQKYKNIVTIFEKNQGPGWARNAGLSIAKGKYVTFLDVDDYWEKNYLKNCLSYFEYDNSIDMLLCGRRQLKLVKQLTEICGVLKYESKIIKHKDFAEDPNVFFKIPGSRGPVCKLFKLDIIKNNNILFPTKIKTMEDLCFCMSYLSNCRNIKIIDDILYNQFIHKDSLSKSTNLDNIEMWNMISKELISIARKYSDINYKKLIPDLLKGFPLMYINSMIKYSEMDFFTLCQNIIHFFNEKEIHKYIINYKLNDDYLVSKLMNHNIYIYLYVIKSKVKINMHKILISIKVNKEKIWCKNQE